MAINRIQTLRSSVTNTVPPAGSRQPGELWINFPDNQLGLIDAARNAQKLLAVRLFSSLGTYAAGDAVLQAGALYIASGAVTPGAFNAGQWTKLTTAADLTAGYLPLSGGTLTGPLTLSGNPGAPLQAAPKQYVDTMLPLAGGTLTGPLILAADPSTGLGAATKAYVDAHSASVGVPTPGGRLTLTSGAPVMSANTTNQGTVYYSPYNSNVIPLWNGTAFVATAFGELSNVLSNAGAGGGPAAAVTNQNYDLFVWLAAGTNPTLTRGPPWSAGTAGSQVVRGTGAGSTAIQRDATTGLYTNVVAITNGPGAGAGTYVGTVTTSASTGATVSFSRGGAGASGVAAIIGLWNKYNRIMAVTQVTDTGTGYTYSAATWRAAHASNTNRCTFVAGLSEDGILASYIQGIQEPAAVGASGTAGMALDVTNTAQVSSTWTNPVAVALGSGVSMNYSWGPLLGLHFIQAVESGDGTNLTTFNNGPLANMTTTLMM